MEITPSRRLERGMGTIPSGRLEKGMGITPSGRFSPTFLKV